MNGKQAKRLRKKYLKEPSTLQALKHFKTIIVEKKTSWIKNIWLVSKLISHPVNDAIGLEKESEKKKERVQVLRLQAVWNGGKRKYKDAKKCTRPST